MTENAIRMESRKNLVRSFMATMPVLTEATQDDLSQIDNSFSARSRRLMDASYGNQNPYEIEKARQAETESRQRTTIQEHAARTFYTLNWAKQITNFGGVQMTNAEKAELSQEMAENADFYIRRMEMRQGRIFSQEEREQLRKAYDRQQELLEKEKTAPLSEAEKKEMEQLSEQLRIDEKTIREAEFCKKQRDQGDDICSVENLDWLGDDHPAVQAGASATEPAATAASQTPESPSLAGEKRGLFTNAPNLTSSFERHASGAATTGAEEEAAPNIEQKRTASFNL